MTTENQPGRKALLKEAQMRRDNAVAAAWTKHNGDIGVAWDIYQDVQKAAQDEYSKEVEALSARLSLEVEEIEREGMKPPDLPAAPELADPEEPAPGPNHLDPELDSGPQAVYAARIQEIEGETSARLIDLEGLEADTEKYSRSFGEKRVILDGIEALKGLADAMRAIKINQATAELVAAEGGEPADEIDQG